MKKLILIAAAVSTSACATVVRGTKDTAKFESTPPAATVTAESISADRLGPFTCVTPCELELKRKRDWSVEFELDGYKPVTGTLEPKVTGGGVASGAGNVLAGGIIGIGVDAGTGANLDLRPNPLVVELAPVDSAEESRVLSKQEAKDDEEEETEDTDAEDGVDENDEE
ncbi:MAG: translation initiation factor 2 [Pseudomonadota bacterium]